MNLFLGLQKKSILGKLFLFLVSVFVFLTISAVIYFNVRTTKEARETQQKTVSNIVQVSRLAYSTPLWTFNMKELQSLNKALLANHDVLAVNLFDGDLFLLSLQKEIVSGRLSDKTAEEYAAPAGVKGIKKIRGDIDHEGQVIGHFDIFYSESGIIKQIRAKNLLLTLFSLITAVFFFASIYLLMKKLFIQPIVDLTGITRTIASNKDYTIELNFANDDEIGMLYDNFQIMIREIHTQENELKRTRGYLENIIESMPSMIVAVNENGYVTQWNKAAESVTGIVVSKALGKTLWDFPMFHDYQSVFHHILSQHQPELLYRQRFEDAKGISYKNVSLFPLIANGVSGVVIRIDDITELERKDEQLRQAQKMEMIGNLAGGLAHDFNNVLGGIIGTISLFKYQLNTGKSLPENKILNYLQTMEDSGRRAADMVQQLLAISRRKEMAFAALDLNEIISHVIKICETTFDKSVEIRVFCPEEKALTVADMTQVEQVLLNLCVNAYHAMTIMREKNESQGGILTVSCEKIIADLQFCRTHSEAHAGAYWRLSVKDTGIGMPQDVVTRIFDPFFTTKEKGKGSGLGLSMVYNIIQMHKGFIDVYTEVGLGSVFNIYLPVSKKDEFIAVVAAETGIKKGEGLILIVDDEKVMREIAQQMLETCGYSVVLAENGEEGFEIFQQRQHDINLVLLDMVMPKMSGRETYIAMKGINRDFKVLLASGFKQDERVEEILKMGVQGFIQKPYTIDKLSQAVYSVLHS